MELQILSYIALFIFLNGALVLRFDTEELVVKNKLCEVIKHPKKAKKIMFFWNKIPENDYYAQQWANHKLCQPRWIFWNAVLHLLYDTKIYIILINIAIFLICFIIPKFL